MTDARTTVEGAVARYGGWIGAGVLVAGAVIVWARYGAPAVVLWFAFAALAGAILLFWEALRALLDPNAPGDEVIEPSNARAPSALLERKHTALAALKDIEFEHSIGRVSDEDYAMLRERYRGEARSAMEALDRDLGAYLERAEEMLATVEREGAVPVASEKPAAKNENARPACAKCGTENDPDAAFCKRCGAKMEGAA